MKRPRLGFTVVEVLALLLTVFILIGLFIRPAGQKSNGGRIKCVNNLKNIGLAVRIFATDNNDQYPGGILLTNNSRPSSLTVADYFLMFTNELSTPKIINCPSDELHLPTKSFTNFTTRNISYFASLTTKPTDPEAFLAGDRNLMADGFPVPSGLFIANTNKLLAWSKEMHVEQGDIAVGDGSVQQYSTSRLRQAARETLLGGTNLLLIP